MRVRLRTDRLQQLLAKSPLSQNHWAIKLGISRGHWSALVNGRHPYPSAKTRLRMLEVFGAHLDDLFEVEPGPAAAHDTDVQAALSSRYLIDREIGQGAMGTVYLGRDVNLGRSVAIKIMSPEAVCGIGVTAFLREIALIARLQHPHILPLFDSGVAAEHPWFVMPWIRGGSLRDRLRASTRLDLDETLRVAAGMAAALDHAHAEHVLHCDVKPANTLLQDSHAYLMDFSIARVLHAEVSEWRARQGMDVSAGTPAYVSPEQANGEADIDGRADVYSLGCVIYEMLAGRPPFEGSTTDAVVARRFTGPPPALRALAPDVPARVAAVIESAMALERDERPGSAGQLVGRLTAAAEGRSPLLSAAGVRVSRAATRARHALPRSGGLMSWLQDFRLTMRSLKRAPRFALAFVLPLALGLGAGMTFFGIVDQVIFRPPPGVSDGGSLLRFAVATERIPRPFEQGYLRSGWVDYDALARYATTLESVAAWSTYRASLGRGEGARTIPVGVATPSFFPLLRVRPQLGRFFGPDDDPPVFATSVPCIASDRLWHNELGGSADALGRRLQVGQISCTIIGVAPPAFSGLGYQPVEIWTPLRSAAWQGVGTAGWSDDRSNPFNIVGRAKAGVPLAAVNEDAARAYRTFSTRTRDPQLTGRIMAQPLLGAAERSLPNGVKLASWLTGGAIALLLLVGANLVNLLVARNLGRSREAAIRLALGGGRARLFRQYLLECLVLALLAGAAAIAVVAVIMPPVRAILFPAISWAQGPLHWRIVAAAIGLALILGGTIAALTVMLAGRADPAELLHGAGRVAGVRRHGGIRMVLVATQAALALVLLMASIGFVRSFRAATTLDLGFDIRNLAVVEFQRDLESAVDSTWRGQIDFYRGLRERLAADAAVEAIALANTSPWYNNQSWNLRIPGRDSLPKVGPYGDPIIDAVGPEYLEVMRIPLRAGRFISAGDQPGSAPVMVINEALARAYWPGQDPIGQCAMIGDESIVCRQIVGIIGNHSFTGTLGSEPLPAYYLPVVQAEEFGVSTRLFMRLRGDAEAQLERIRRLAQGFVPGLPSAEVRLMQLQFDPLLAPWRLGALAFTGLGVLAALIAMLGLFSVLAYLVAERRREFAIRGALGAQAAQILGPVVRQGLLVVGVGAAAGVLLAMAAARWLQPQMFRVQLLDPAVLASVLAGLLLMALAASLGPARSAAKADPMQVLRVE